MARSTARADEAYARLKEAGTVVVPNHRRETALGATIDCLRKRAAADGHRLTSRRLPGIPSRYEISVRPRSDASPA
jgi:hypothetical protein